MNEIEKMKQDLLNKLEAMALMDMNEIPNYKVSKMLQSSYVKHGLPEDFSTELVSKMTVEVNQNFMDDIEYVEKVVEVFSKIIINFYNQCKEDNLELFIINNASLLEFKFEM